MSSRQQLRTLWALALYTALLIALLIVRSREVHAQFENPGAPGAAGATGCTGLSDASAFCNGTNAANLTGTVALARFPSTLPLAAVAIASLPTCDATHSVDQFDAVNNADSCVAGVLPSHTTGTTHCPVYCDGAGWKALY
jgi:hypothetical protein